MHRPYLTQVVLYIIAHFMPSCNMNKSFPMSWGIVFRTESFLFFTANCDIIKTAAQAEKQQPEQQPFAAVMTMMRMLCIHEFM